MLLLIPNSITVKFVFQVLILFLALHCHCQELTGRQLLDKAIHYHDPNAQWNSFSGRFYVIMESPNRPERVSDIRIDLPKSFFSIRATIKEDTSTYVIHKDSVTMTVNGIDNPSEALLEEFRMSRERGLFLKNYYTYLYGLPMKLNDPGTIIHEVVEEKIFKGNPYYVLKVTYEVAVGDDTWYFYFNKESYKMEVYQFFHDESKHDGEYILLSDEETINGIKMPKVRSWYTNKNNTLLGTDILNPAI